MADEGQQATTSRRGLLEAGGLALIAAASVSTQVRSQPEESGHGQSPARVDTPAILTGDTEPGRTTADVLVDKLAAWGVDTVFGLPGDGITAILDAFRRNQDRIRFVLVRHEEAAAFMASGWAKYTGRLGCCIGTTGPGAVHLLNGLYDAKMDGAPVMALTGSTYHDLGGMACTQGVDAVKLYEDVALFNERVSGPEHLLNLADRAARAALAGPGVAHLTFPIDVQTMPFSADRGSCVRGEARTSSVFLPVRDAPPDDQLQRAADVLNAGSRTVVLVGQGALGAAAEVEQMADLLGAPVAKALLGKAVLADDHPFTTGGTGHLGTTASERALHECDTLLIVGSTMPWMQFYPKPGQARTVQIDRDPARIGLRTPVEAPLAGDWNTALARMEASTESPLRPQVVAGAVGRMIAPDAILSLDCGANTLFGARHIPLRPTNKLALGGNLSTMAPGLPFAIAGQLAYPERQCVAFVGDGGFAMLMAELSTAVKYALPIRVVVLRNDHYSRIESEDREAGFPPFATAIQGIDLVKFAEACGATGFQCARAAEVEPTLRAAFAHPGPALVEARVSNDEQPSAPSEYLKQASG